MFKTPLCLLVALAVGAGAGVFPAAGSASELAIRFVALDAATHGGSENNSYVDLGAVAAAPQKGRKGITIRRRVGVHLAGAPGTPATARLSVALTAEMPGCTLRVDGIALSTIPRLIAPAHRVGTPVAHDIEVMIPADVPAGPFLSALQWTAESN